MYQLKAKKKKKKDKESLKKHLKAGSRNPQDTQFEIGQHENTNFQKFCPDTLLSKEIQDHLEPTIATA